MITPELMYVEKDSLLNSKEIILRTTKSQTLNILMAKLKDLLAKTKDKVTIATINYDLIILEDAYNVDMYAFQFKGLKEIIEKDIKNLSESIALENI